MRTLCLFVLCTLLSCQKQKSEPQVAGIIQKKEIKKGLPPEKKSQRIDTILINGQDDEPSKTEYILACLLDQKADKDSIITEKYRLDFYQNKIKTASSKLTIKGVTEGSDWSASYKMSSPDAKNTSFIALNFGYPACGYAHNNYLYYLNNNNLELVHEWFTMSDSGWGSWVEFTNPSGKSDPDSFYCKTVAFEPDDENDEMGYEKHYDSIVFQLKNNHWTKKMLTTEDKAYFEKKQSFDEFHKIQ